MTWRRAFWCSVAGYVLAPVGAYVFLSGDGDSLEWWRWLVTTLAFAPLWLASMVAWRAVSREDLFPAADRKVWRGWMRFGGPFVTAFILRAAERAERRLTDARGQTP